MTKMFGHKCFKLTVVSKWTGQGKRIFELIAGQLSRIENVLPFLCILTLSKALLWISRVSLLCAGYGNDCKDGEVPVGRNSLIGEKEQKLFVKRKISCEMRDRLPHLLSDIYIVQTSIHEKRSPTYSATCNCTVRSMVVRVLLWDKKSKDIGAGLNRPIQQVRSTDEMYILSWNTKVDVQWRKRKKERQERWLGPGGLTRIKMHNKVLRRTRSLEQM